MSGRGGRWFMIGLGLSIALLGTVFFGLMLRSFLRAYDMRSWPEVPCVIISSEIEQRRHNPQSPLEFRHSVTYGYEWQGQPRTSEQFSLRGSPWTSKPGVVEKRASAYPVGARLTCRIHPLNPDTSVLVMDSLAPGYSIWFPALFIIGGMGISIRHLRLPKKI